MKQKVAVPALAAVLSTLLWSPLIVRAAEEPAQPYPPGTLLTVAGNGSAGLSGDGGPATAARLNNPFGIATDATGNLFIADGWNNRVRKVSPDGAITTIAGTGTAGTVKDGQLAVKAGLGEVESVTVDRAGNLYVSDCDNNAVWKLAPTGTLTRVARFGCPQQVAVDPAGNLYIGDVVNHQVRKVDPAGVMTTAAGGGNPADGRGDGGLATEARLIAPFGVALDSAGNLYISDFADNRVRLVTPDGKIRTVAGGGQPAQGVGDGGPATEAHLDGPSYIAVDAGGNLFIPENRGARIRKVSPAGIISTVAGTGDIGRTGDGGLATAARLNSPQGVAIDRAGNLYFSEGGRYPPSGAHREAPGNELIRKVVGGAVPR